MAERGRLGLQGVVRWFGRRRATAATISALEANRAKAIELGLYWDETLPASDEAYWALRHLQLALFYANTAVALNAPPENPLPEDMPPGHAEPHPDIHLG